VGFKPSPELFSADGKRAEMELVKAVGQWSKRLGASIKEKLHHFKHHPKP